MSWITLSHQFSAFFSHFLLIICHCCLFVLPVLHHSNRSVMRWAGLSWGPDVVGLSVGQPAAAVPARSAPGGIRPVYNPPIINTAGELTPHCYCCLLLFIFCLTSKGHNATPVTLWACGNGCFLQQGLRTLTTEITLMWIMQQAAGNRAEWEQKAVRTDTCDCFSVWWEN